MNQLFNPIDNLLNKVTMYRLMLYFLRVLLATATVLSFLDILPYNGWHLLTSGLYLITMCWVFNQFFASLFKVKPNYESQYITGLILALIVGPLPLLSNIILLTLLPFLAMGSKYLLTYKSQHIFNPAALAVVLAAILFGQGASWWIGDRIMLPLIIVGGLLVVRKMRRFHLVFSFLGSFAFFLLAASILQYGGGITDLPAIITSTLLSPPILFFTFVMLTEPITSPADTTKRTYYGIVTGLLFVFFQTFFSIFYSLELALLSANILGRLISFSYKYRLVLKERKQIANDLWLLLFEPFPKINFLPGQFLEWTLPHQKPDSRGNRRYFTIASSPTEDEIMLVVRVPDKASTYKRALLHLPISDHVAATNLEGNFLLKSLHSSYVFIAGGIGITPFRSMIKYLLDTKQKADITLFYLTHTEEELVFQDIFARAEKELGIKVIYVLSDPKSAWKGEKGRLTKEMIKKYVPAYQSHYFYISGPQPMVATYRQLLQGLNVPSTHVKTDYFPGYTESFASKT